MCTILFLKIILFILSYKNEIGSSTSRCVVICHERTLSSLLHVNVLQHSDNLPGATT